MIEYFSSASFSLYEILWMFFFYSFLGWCLEVAYAAMIQGKFVNRGFLAGPYCPIYGVGGVIINLVLTPIIGNILLSFFISIILATALELFTGYILEMAFHQHWWDYSDRPFNFKGYVCLEVSIFWGIACMFMVYCIQPLINAFITVLSNPFGVLILILIYLTIITDEVITLISLLKIRNKIIYLDDINRQIEKLSNVIGSNIADGTKGVAAFNKKHHQDIAELMSKYDAIASGRIFGLKRLSKAFPLLKDKALKTVIQKNDVKNTKKN